MLIIYENIPGGVYVYNQNLIKYLLQENIEFEVLKYNFVNNFNTELRNEGRIYHATFSAYASRYEIFGSVKELLYKHDLIVCHDSYELEIINYFKLKSKLVFILHGDLTHYQNILNEKSGFIDYVFCVSNSLMLHYSNVYKHIKFSCVHPLTIDFPENITINSDKPLQILYAGRYVNLKGADLLNTLFKNLLEVSKIEISIYLPENGNDEILIKDIPKGVNVVYGSSNESILERFENNDFLIFPSRSEGFGLVVIEGMKRGVVPIVLDQAFGPRDMIDHSINGFSLKEEEFITEAFSIILSYKNDRIILADLKNNASAIANEKFSFNDLGMKFLSSIDEVKKNQKDKSFYKTRFSLLEKILHPFVYKYFKYSIKS